jgi:predicted ribosome quality control (RQC) complex YloA/Tae2 family protein
LRLKEFTSFDVSAVVRELKTTIVDSRVNNVYQPEKKTLLLKLHKPDVPAFQLVLEAGRRLNLTAYASEKPSAPPAFCMALRKYLRNAWLTGIEQFEFERVIVLSFKSQTGVLRLVCEFFGEGNFSLVGEDGKILQALYYKRMRDRDIVRSEPFRFAPPFGKNPFKVGKEELAAGLRASGDIEVVRAFARLLGVGGVHAEEVLLLARVDKLKHCASLSEEEVGRIFDTLQQLLTGVTTGALEPCVVLNENGGFVDVLPLHLKRYESPGFSLRSYGSFNEALDEFYVRVSAVEQAASDEVVEGLKREAERLERMVAHQERVLHEAEAKAEEDKQVGNTIYAHITDLQTLMDKFSMGKGDGKEWKATVAQVLAEKATGSTSSFDSFDNKNLTVNVCIDGLRFGLDMRKTLYETAASYYERGKRAKQRLEGAETALSESRKKLEDTQQKIREAEALEQGKPAELLQELEKRRVKHKEWFEKFRWFHSSEGVLVVAGRDAVTNEVLVKKHVQKDEVVFHADIVGAPFVVVKTDGKTPSEESLREAGEFAALFSKGWRENFGAVDVYWVKPSQLSKTGTSGESVGHGAFVVRGERNWQRGTPLKLAIGVIAGSDGSIKFVGGPVASVQAKTQAYVVIVPGDLAGKELFRRILSALAGKVSKEARGKVLKASVEMIRDFVPYGKGRLLELEKR